MGKVRTAHLLDINATILSTRLSHRSYVITHGHLDHINGLILSAGSLRGPPRQVFAAQQTLKDIETVFSDRLWPNLGTWDKEDKSAALLYSP